MEQGQAAMTAQVRAVPAEPERDGGIDLLDEEAHGVEEEVGAHLSPVRLGEDGLIHQEATEGRVRLG